MASLSRLMEPIEVGPAILRNRIISSANYSAMAENGFFGERLSLYHAEKAKGGVALTITEELSVHFSSDFGQPRNVRAYDKAATTGFNLFSSMVHAQGALTVGQLWHGGVNLANRDPWNLRINVPLSVSPTSSTMFQDGTTFSKEMTLEDICDIQNGYIASARNLIEGGFDGIEIHATHGYLPNQFLSPLYNRRTDKYGGSKQNRMRFLSELVESLAEETAHGKLLGISIVGDEYFPGGLGLDETIPIIQELDATGKVDYFIVTPGGFALRSNLNNPPMYFDYSLFRSTFPAVKKVLRNAKLFAVGRITSPVLAEEILSRGEADAVIMMRAQIADPHLANKVKRDQLEDIIPCVGCNQACYGHVVGWANPISCILNPTVGREKEWGEGTLQLTANPKNIAIVGGGPAGCEAAIIASKRGHHVTLFERSEALGGQVLLASFLPGRSDFVLAVQYWKKQLKKHRVNMVLNHEVTLEDISNSSYDLLIIATGSNPDKIGFSPIFTLRLGIPGVAGNPIVVTPDEILLGYKNAGRRVVVYDDQGDSKAAAISEFLAQDGREVEVISRLGMLAQFSDNTTRIAAQSRAFQKFVKYTQFSLIKKVENKTIHVTNIFNQADSIRENVDTLILVTWRYQENKLYNALKQMGKKVFAIGDCVSPRTIEEAVYEGHKLGREI